MPSKDASTVTLRHNADALMDRLQALVEAADAYLTEGTGHPIAGPGEMWVQMGNEEPFATYMDMAMAIEEQAKEHGLVTLIVETGAGVATEST